ncbi:MAG TPA: ATP-binding protein [Steroidobacteraceae bacterium]|nr:ATP-binding protein [Steroidobacteraceae bacterium]
MSAHSSPIRRQLIGMVLLTTGAVVLLTTAALFAYDFVSFRQSSRQQLDTLGRAIAANATAALAFDNSDDAESVLAAFEADRHIAGAALYDPNGKLFAVYPKGTSPSAFPTRPQERDFTYRFEASFLSGFLPVSEGGRRLGTLFVRSDVRAINERIRVYGGIVAALIGASALLAYAISRQLQYRISRPILELAKVATAISTRRDYSVRAPPADTYELDTLTGAFNHMLTEIQSSESRLRVQLSHLSLLQHITRAISDRQDLSSIFQVVLTSLEQSLPIEFCCVCRRDGGSGPLLVNTIGAASRAYCEHLELNEQAALPVETSGFTACLEGRLLYEPDTRAVALPLPQRLADSGLRSMVVAPLMAESTFFGVLIAARRQAEGFTSADCEFLKQLAEHVALAVKQSQLNSALQQAYDDLRQTQQTVMQQERLRALGQMASGIAHDINNAISPVSLYTESLLEREPNLSERARAYLTTIQRAIDDVAGTVARMREFYRQRETQLTLAKVDLNRTIQQAIDLTHARWSDLPQQRGIMVELRKELSRDPAEVMVAEGEMRDALTNLIFNAVDAMPEGGTLTLRTRVTEPAETDHARRVHVEVSDTGIGMDEATRRRCLEPFFTTKGDRGSGLGLAMVYGMVQRHSAELQIDSELGRGSTFRLVFAEADQDQEGTVRMPTVAIPRRLRILLVDDDPLLIKSLEDILQADGHAVTVAGGGQAGIDTFTASVKAGKPFALVITDLGMPHVDGRRVAGAVKAASPMTPVIMLTGWGQRLVAENDIPPDVNRVLNKPPRLNDLRQALAELATVGDSSGRPDESREALA